MADPGPTDPTATAEAAISLADVERVLRVVIRVSQRWAALMLLLAALSTVSLTFKGGQVEGTVAITPITVALVAFIWLPALVNLIALAGGGVKTPAGEVQSGSILMLIRSLAPEAQRAALPAVIAALDTGASRDNASVAQLRERLQGELAGLPVDAAEARQRLTSLARQYETIRATMPSGAERTFKMTQIVSEAQGLAAGARLDPRTLTGLFQGPGDGDRIVTLALISARPEAAQVPIVIDAIENARSPFEQYHELIAARRLSSVLSVDDRKRLAVAIQNRMGLRMTGISIDRRDGSRLLLAQQVLAALEPK
jgi:hypothetical protein